MPDLPKDNEGVDFSHFEFTSTPTSETGPDPRSPKKRKKLFILLGILGALIIIQAVIFIFTRPPERPEPKQKASTPKANNISNNAQKK